MRVGGRPGRDASRSTTAAEATSRHVPAFGRPGDRPQAPPFCCRSDTLPRCPFASPASPKTPPAFNASSPKTRPRSTGETPGRRSPRPSRCGSSCSLPRVSAPCSSRACRIAVSISASRPSPRGPSARSPASRIAKAGGDRGVGGGGHADPRRLGVVAAHPRPAGGDVGGDPRVPFVPVTRRGGSSADRRLRGHSSSSIPRRLGRPARPGSP